MAMNSNRAGFGIVEIIIGVVIIAMIIAGGVFIWNTYQKANAPIDSYASCAAAGNTIIQTYPEQCVGNGQTYTNPDQKPVQKR